MGFDLERGAGKGKVHWERKYLVVVVHLDGLHIVNLNAFGQWIR
jgi:hypothetical protein